MLAFGFACHVRDAMSMLAFLSPWQCNTPHINTHTVHRAPAAPRVTVTSIITFQDHTLVDVGSAGQHSSCTRRETALDPALRLLLLLHARILLLHVWRMRGLVRAVTD